MVWTIVYTIRDEKGKQSTFSINVPNTLNVAQVSAFAIDFAALVAAVIKGAVVGIGINLSVNLSADYAGGTPASGSDVEEKGYFQFVTDNGFYTAFNVPTLDEAKVLANSNQLDTADADVLAIIAAMTTGLTVLSGEPDEVVVNPCDVRGENIASMAAALEVFAASGRARR